MSKLQELQPVAVAVLPTPTVLTTIRTLRATGLTLEVTNQDASQTLDVFIYRRCTDTGPWSLSPLSALFAAIPALGSVCVDMDVWGTVDLQVRGTASGAGLNARLGALSVERRP
jgi:hypothetical protein